MCVLILLSNLKVWNVNFDKRKILVWSDLFGSIFLGEKQVKENFEVAKRQYPIDKES